MSRSNKEGYNDNASLGIKDYYGLFWKSAIVSGVHAKNKSTQKTCLHEALC